VSLPEDIGILMNMKFSDTLVRVLRQGGCAVIPTDTIYGVVASAGDTEAVERVYTIKGRSPQKPCIILLDQAERMRMFGVSDEHVAKVLAYSADTPTSFIVPIFRDDLGYLDRGTHTLAFRIPQIDALHMLLTQTGPLIAPSANPEGQPPATTIGEAQAYFGGSVDAYEDGGTIEGKPSALIDVESGERLR
jgi:L-threonylcarbamoyladenylate synthase